MELTENLTRFEAVLGMCLYMMLVANHIRFISQEIDWGKSKPKDKKKKAKKPTLAELEALVKQMFPEAPEADERSQVREAVVAAIKQSARGMFDLLPEDRCISLLKMIAGAGKGCPRCGSKKIKEGQKGGYRKYYQRCICQVCKEKGRTASYYELTGTIFAGTHLTAKQWFWGMYLFVGGCSSREIGIELAVSLKTAQRLVRLLQLSLITARYRFMLRGKVEYDEVYVIGGLKGEAGGLKLERAARKRGLKQPGRGTWDSDKVPILGLVDRQGHLYLVPCVNVKTETIQFLIEYLTKQGATVYTDSYNIYNFLARVGYQHQRVNHSQGEYARGEVHVNTVEGLWSLLRDHLRVHRGVSKLYLPLYVMRFEFLVNHRGENRWSKMMELCTLACQADGVRLRRLVRDKQVHTACPTLGLVGQVG